MTTDAKLSPEKRESLPKTSFCGPGRSFPIPDCAHVTAARRLLNRSKYSESTKQKILSCVNRKAKSMGCDKSKDYTDDEINKIIDSDDFKSARDLIDFISDIETLDYNNQDMIFKLKEKATDILITKRLSRGFYKSEDIEDIRDALIKRSIDSILDSLSDELSIK